MSDQQFIIPDANALNHIGYDGTTGPMACATSGQANIIGMTMAPTQYAMVCKFQCAEGQHWVLKDRHTFAQESQKSASCLCSQDELEAAIPHDEFLRRVTAFFGVKPLVPEHQRLPGRIGCAFDCPGCEAIRISKGQP